MEETKQELSNKYAELGAITEQLAIVKMNEQAIIKLQNSILEKIQELKKTITESENDTESN